VAAQAADAADARSKAAQAGADKTSAKEAAQQLEQKFLNNDTGLKIRVLDDSDTRSRWKWWTRRAKRFCAKFRRMKCSSFPLP
jgi:hypothetical protein